MTEFYNQPVVEPLGTDSLLVVRDRQPRRATVADLQRGFSEEIVTHVGTTPPTDPKKLLWCQTTPNGTLIARWQRTAIGLWVSQQTWGIDAFMFEVKRDESFPSPNPCPGASIWIDSFMARGWVWDAMKVNEYIDFELKLVNSQQQQTTLFYFRLEGAALGAVFNFSEPVHQSVALNDAVALWLSIKRGGQTKLKTTTLAATMRRIYATS